MKLRSCVLAAVLVTATACGTSGGGGGSGATLELFQIGPIESQTASLPMLQTGAQAAVDEINAAGGVHGKQIKLTTCNDRYDANEALRCAQEGARGDAVALVGSLSNFGAQVLPVLEEAGLPSIGADAITPVDAQSTANYLFDPGVPAFAGMPFVAAQQMGATKIASIHIETAGTATTQSYFDLGAKAAGVQNVAVYEIPADTLDYATYIAQATAAGAQVFVSSMSPEANLKLWKAIADAGSPIKVVASAGTVSEAVITEAGAAAEGSYVVAGTPDANPTNPTGQAFTAALQKYSPGTASSGLGLRAWASVHLFAEVAGGIQGDVTRESLTAALNQVDGLDFLWIDGLSFAKPGPIAELPRIASATVFPSRIQGGKLVPLDSLDPFGATP
ncbi:ABC transporter substrate-binding protein [Pseudonocardia sp. NPDC049154]|uniref:ABC transporter substrate-binding protein n=1 Tax=Pseudonocardia sp. NPDC049154 TaxID=3155501 RepID=UPI0033D5F425